MPPYPDALLSMQKPPARLYAIGNPAVLDRQAIAIVGARKATASGRAFARSIARGIAKAGGCVVSGLAVGIDAAAHEGALDVADGRTCAVLGGGFAHAVPAPNRILRHAIASRGLLLSEWEPWVHADRWMFPHRNRVIAALSRATIIVEASATSGSLHTAHAALGLERPIGIVPGPVDSDTHRGSNDLLKHAGATVILTVDDAVGLLGSRVERPEPPPHFTDDQARVWDALAVGAANVDTIAIRAHLTTTQCIAAIGLLEFAGAIECGFDGEVRRR